MLIDSPDLLKTWLTSYLAPLCDADPEALAKYCLALVRKDRPVSELKASMIEQLDVFLQTNTKSFVDKFLQVTQARSYLPKKMQNSSSSTTTNTTTTTTNTITTATNTTTATTGTTTTSATTTTTGGTNTATSSVVVSSEVVAPPPLPPTLSKPPTGNSPDSTTPPSTAAVTTETPPLAPPPVATSTPATTSIVTPPTPTPPVASTIKVPPPPPPVAAPEVAPPPPPPVSVIVRKEEASSSQRSRKENDRDRDDRRGRRRSHSRGRSRSRSRSGSRGRDRRRSRSRGRNRNYDRRRRSPISKRYRRSRTRSRTRSPRRSRSRDRKSRSRDRKSRSRNRSISPRGRRGRSPIRSASPPPPPRKAKSIPQEEKRESPQRSSPVPEGAKLEAVRPGDRDRVGERDRVADRLADRLEGVRGGDMITAPLVVTKSRPDFPLPPKKQRCRDYDEKGYCMRGDMCSYDHGSDPVVLEGISGVLDFPPPTNIPPTNIPPPGYTPAPAPPPGVPRPRHPPPRPPHYEYTPREPSMWVNQPGPSQGIYYGGGPGPRFSAPPPPIPSARELINVPVNNGTHVGGVNSGGGVGPSLAKRLGPVVTTTLSRHPAPMKMARPDLDSCTLELRKIPPGLNTIAHLNDHFSKFGTVVNIQVHHEGNPDCALVTFSGHSEANAAYRSTEAVLNNRFIKVFWHTPQGKGGAPSTYPHHLSRPLQDRLGARHPNKTLNKLEEGSSRQVLLRTHGALAASGAKYTPAPLASTGGSLVVSTGAGGVGGVSGGPKISPGPPTSPLGSPLGPLSPEPVDLKKAEIEAILKSQEILAAEVAAKHRAEKQKLEAIKLKSEVELRSKQLLGKQVEQLKKLIVKLEEPKLSMDEKKKLLETIKSLQAAIDATKKLKSEDPPKTDAPARTKAQLDKEILDTELELYGVQAENGDVHKLRVKLGQLRSQQAAYGYPPTRSIRHSPYTTARGTYRGGRGIRGGIRGRGRGIIGGRGYGHSFSSVDRRTTKVNASGFEREDKEEVLAHFSGYGKVSTYIWDDQTPTVTIQYSTRREAEKAMTEGRTLGDRLLTLTWAFDTSPQLSPTIGIPQLPQSKGLSTPQARLQASFVTPHSTASLLSPEETMEEITEEIVEEVETEEAETPVVFEEEEEVEEEEEEEVRSWRR